MFLKYALSTSYIISSKITLNTLLCLRKAITHVRAVTEKFICAFYNCPRAVISLKTLFLELRNSPKTLTWLWYICKLVFLFVPTWPHTKIFWNFCTTFASGNRFFTHFCMAGRVDKTSCQKPEVFCRLFFAKERRLALTGKPDRNF